MRRITKTWRGLGQLEGCIPVGSLVSWTGNLNARAYGDAAPPLAHVLDDCTSGTTGSGCSLKSWLESRYFELISVEWLAGYLNPYVKVLVRAKAFFNNKEEAARYITDALNGIADARMDEVRIEVKPESCPAPEPAPAQLCPRGYEVYFEDIGDGLRQGGCRPIKRKVKGANPFVTSFTPMEWGFDFQSDYVSSEPAGQANVQSATPLWGAAQTQTPSGDGASQTTTSAWVWLILAGIGVLVIMRS